MLDDASVAHDGDVVGDGERLAVIVRDEQCGRVLGREDGPQIGRQPLAQASVEGRERLVEEQQPRSHREGARERHTLLLTAGQRCGRTLLVARQPDEVEQLPDACGLLGAPHTTSRQPVGDIRGDVEVPEQLAVLEHQREVALVRRHTRHVVAVEADAPRVETLQPCDGA